MPEQIDFDELFYGIDWQRAKLEDARRDFGRAAVAQRESELRLRALSRSTRSTETAEAPDAAIMRVANDRESAARNRKSAAQRVRAEATKLQNDLATHVGVTPEEEIARLTAELPIVLLPVRLETRFRGTQLLVRIYPDDIFAESHEPELTNQEIADGESFWRAAWPDEAAERSAWKGLIDKAGATRAAWIAQALTPTNVADRPAQPPQFPTPSIRTSSWTRAAEARLLPDRWHVLCYRNGQQTSLSTGGVIAEPLALTIAPMADASERKPLTADGLVIDESVRWTVDFEAAVKAGMALRIDLSPSDRIEGFDRVLVFGVKSSLTPERCAGELESLLKQHRFDRGVALLPQGVPTNNSAAGPTAYPPNDPDGSASFEIERRGLSVSANQDGGLLMTALGMPLAAATNLAGANREGDRAAIAMARALWPVTLGYFLEQLMDPVFSSDAIALTQRFFVRYVRGRGPLPAFRIGNTPYGVVPVTALGLWQPTSTKDALDRELPKALHTLRSLWLEKVPDVPCVGRTNDPDSDLLAMLGMDASMREVRIRSVFGEGVQWNLAGFFGGATDWQGWLNVGEGIATDVLTRLGHPEWSPRIARFTPCANAWPLSLPVVTDGTPSEHDGLSPNYIDWILHATVPELNAEAFPAGVAFSALLYRLLRHAALLEFHDSAFQLLTRYNVLSAADRLEPELVGLPTKERRLTRLDRLAQPLAQVSGGLPLHTFLENPANAAVLHTLLPNGPVLDFRDALRVLSVRPTAELHRLCGETLDVVSHRIDAWITALATKRLDEMRARRAAGCHIGAFGWVENLRPRPALTIEKLSDGREAVRQPDNGGHIHAPSMTHAATAAILRNAYLSRSGPEQSRYAVNLSSSRVRLGRFLLDAVREGQPLGAVLGYRVERGLHERRADRLIAPLRSLYPLVAKKANDPADLDEPTEQIAARNVVDGMSLRRAYQEGRIPWATADLPTTSAERAALEAELTALDAAVDAVSDLLLAEAVHQLVKGSPTVASATLDAMAQGTVRPPDPEIALQPRSGTALTHRVAVIVGGGNAPQLPNGWPAAATVRAAVEPSIDAWLGNLIGDPRLVQCTVEIGPSAAPIGNTTVSLAELGMRPIDTLALVRASTKIDPAATRAGSSELDRRIQDCAYTKLGVTTDVETRITYELSAAANRMVDRGFGDILEIVRAVLAVLARSRSLVPGDLIAEDSGTQVQDANLQPDDAIARATTVRIALDQLVAQTLVPALEAAVAAPDAPDHNLSPLRSALRSAAIAGIPSAYPVTSRGNGISERRDLIAQAASVKEELDRRIKKANDVLTEAEAQHHATDASYRVRAATEAVSILLGADMPFLPLFKPATPGELANALQHGSNASFIAATAEARRRAISRFEIVASRVRPALDAWRRLGLMSSALNRPAVAREVVQLPYVTDARWVALPFATEKERPRPGRISVLIHRVASPEASDSWAGLLLDSWTEFIPLPTEQTGVAFHYDNPGAEAPQTLLLAVPPKSAKQWELSWLVATLNETLDLAKIRAVDSELLGELGQLLPAIYLADSTDEVTVRTSFSDVVRQEMEIIAAQAEE